jgi:hypothetical protein
MDDFFALFGEKTCELMRLVGWRTYHGGTCHLLNVTHPLSHQFQAQYIEIGQQAFMLCIVAATLFGIFAIMVWESNQFKS